ncbi:hypothetical protein [Paenibacillus amylolyticus]|uniref:hypothetical protein n=1 Tax=Paenibacillus amylolyticus TaxID=1451 RepID=UPI0033984C75
MNDFYLQLQQLGSFSHHDLIEGYENLGHVWDVYPEYNNNEQFYFGWVYEKQSVSSSHRIILKNTGDNWLSFLTPCNPKAMSEFSQAAVHVLNKKGVLSHVY